MGYVMLLIAALVVVLIVVLLVRAQLFKPLQMERPARKPISLDTPNAFEHLAEMIKIPTISNVDMSTVDMSAFERFKSLLMELYPTVYKVCEYEQPAETGILLRWKGKSPKDPIVLMSHYDVVTVIEDMWENPPFEGKIIGDTLWGRGTLDTKCTLCSIMEAAEALMKQGVKPERDIYLAFAGDEEVLGRAAQEMVKLFEGRGIRPALVLDEGGAVVRNVFPGVDKQIAVIGIGEKGLANVSLTVKGEGGHASTPPKHTAVGVLAQAIVASENKPFNTELTYPARLMFERIGRHAGFGMRILCANLWLFAPVVRVIGSAIGGELGAMMKTTMAVTMASGSKQTNVLPNVATAYVNLRLINSDTLDDVVKHITKAVNNPKVKVEIVSGNNASSYADVNSEGYKLVERAVAATWGEAIVSPYLMVACSDSRHYNRISDTVLKFSALELSKEELGRIHNHNERITKAQLDKCIMFYAGLFNELVSEGNG